MKGMSLNRWPVPPRELKTFKVPGANRRLTLDKDAGRVLVALAADYHRLVRPIDKGRVDEGGYNPRNAALTPGQLSNHASGTAIDLNWSEEGALGSKWGREFFATAKAKAGLAVLRRRYGSVVAWGGDWRARDYMHWEIKPGVTRGQVLTFCKRKRIDEDGVRS